jgi:murein L,D-transpeptidase YafK
MHPRRNKGIGCNAVNIAIHGLSNEFRWLGAAHRLQGWTDGCIVVTDSEIEEIWRLVRVGTSVEIRR